MVPNSKRYFTNYLLKVTLIVIFLFVLLAIHSTMNKYDIGETALRQPDILNLQYTEYRMKNNDSPIVLVAQVTPKSMAENNTNSTSKIAKMISLEDNDERKSMSAMLWKFPWKELEKGAESNQSLYLKHRQSLIDSIEKFAYLEPETPINTSCHPPNLINHSMIDCSKYPNAFLQNRSNHTVKVGHAIQLGFDVDTLEIHLNEIYDVIDYFFIIESTHIHCESFRKQLTWDHVSTQPRFTKFRNKVVHLVIDDSEYAQTKRREGDRENAWVLESLQERLRWEKIKEWNQYTKAFSGDDLIGFGDADEIASRENIQLLKNCPLKYPTIDIGIWFPFGRMDQAFRSDFPISRPKHPYTLGDPTYFRWKDIDTSVAVFKKTVPTRMRGKSKGYLLGGAHLSYYTFLPYFLLRIFSSTECGKFDGKRIKTLFTDPLEKGKGKLELMEAQFHKRVTHLGNRLHKIKDIKENLSNIIKVPWFYECNKNRYPSWEGRHDSRVT